MLILFFLEVTNFYSHFSCNLNAMQHASTIQMSHGVFLSCILCATRKILIARHV
jgi:hypothetical protein